MTEISPHEEFPVVLGFRMPAEFEPHDGCWMLWPRRGDVWRYGGKPAQMAFVEVATAIASSELVTVGVSDEQYINRCSLSTGLRGYLPERRRWCKPFQQDTASCKID